MLKLASLFALISGLSFGQAGLTQTCPTNVKAGSPLICTLSLSGGTGPAAFQFTLSYGIQITGTSMILSPVMTSAGKSVSCGPTPTICIVYGGTAQIPDGTIGTISYQASKSALGNFQVGLNASVVASPTATLIASTVNPSVPVSSSSPCDITGDGQTNAADIASMVSEIQKSQTIDDLNSDSKVDVVDLQIEIIAVSSGVCNAK